MKKIIVSVCLWVKDLAVKAEFMDGEIALPFDIYSQPCYKPTDKPEQTTFICSMNNGTNFLIQNRTVMGQAKHHKSLPFLLRFSHFFELILLESFHAFS